GRSLGPISKFATFSTMRKRGRISQHSRIISDHRPLRSPSMPLRRPAMERSWHGNPPRDDIDGNSIGSQLISGEFSDILVLPHVGPVLCQHAPAERVDLAESHRLETARALQAEREAANAGEKVEHLELAHPAPPTGSMEISAEGQR